MVTTRYVSGSSSDNLSALLRLIADPNCRELRLFVSPDSLTGSSKGCAGNADEFPSVAALARYEIKRIAELYIVFDGCILTAKRRPCFLEVVTLMNAAQESSKVGFATSRAPFTSSLTPEAAGETLLGVGPVVPFTEASRNQYFALLSNVSEVQWPLLFSNFAAKGASEEA